MTTAFAYYLIAFELKYLGGSIYINAVITSLSEIAGKLSAGVVMVKIGLRPLYLFSFGFAAIGTACIIAWPSASQFQLGIFLLLTRFGASMALAGTSLGTVLIIPTQLVTTVMGICNFFARLLTMLAPFIAESKPPLPMIVLESFFVIAFVAANFLRIPDEIDQNEAK
jgi:hypothetical protein